MTSGTEAVKLTSMDVPEIIYRGESLWLNCSYDLENEPLYSVKWFKKNLAGVIETDPVASSDTNNRADGDGEEEVWSEFYRFIPNDDDPQRAFPMTGVNVDVSACDLSILGILPQIWSGLTASCNNRSPARVRVTFIWPKWISRQRDHTNARFQQMPHPSKQSATSDISESTVSMFYTMRPWTNISSDPMIAGRKQDDTKSFHSLIKRCSNNDAPLFLLFSL